MGLAVRLGLQLKRFVQVYRLLKLLARALDFHLGFALRAGALFLFFGALDTLPVAQVVLGFVIFARTAEEQVERFHHDLDLLVELAGSAGVVVLHNYHLVHHDLLLPLQLQHLVPHVVDFEVLGHNDLRNLARQVLELPHELVRLRPR